MNEPNKLPGQKVSQGAYSAFFPAPLLPAFEWTPRLIREYFLIGVARTSQDALSRASRINVILAQWQREVAGESTNTPLRIVDLLAANPFITATGLSRVLAVASPTSQIPICPL